MICPHQRLAASCSTSDCADWPSGKTNGIAPGRMKRVEKGLDGMSLIVQQAGSSSLRLVRLGDDHRHHGRHAAQRERLLKGIFPAAAEEKPQPHAPLDAEDR